MSELIRLPKDPCETYITDLCVFLKNPKKTQILGAIAMLRSMTEIVSSALKEYKAALSKDDSVSKPGQSLTPFELVVQKYDELNNLNKDVSCPLHYQGYRGGDILSSEAADYMLHPTALCSDEEMCGAPVGTVLLVGVERLVSLLTTFREALDADSLAMLDRLSDAATNVRAPAGLAKGRQSTGSHLLNMPFDLEAETKNVQLSGLHNLIGTMAHIIRAADNSKKQFTRIQLLSLAAAGRIIAEATGHYLCWKTREFARDAKQDSIAKRFLSYESGTDPQSLTNCGAELRDYVTYLETVRNKVSDPDERSEIMNAQAMMSRIANLCNLPLDEIEKASKSKQVGTVRGLKRFDTAMKPKNIQDTIVNAAALAEILVTAPLPDSLQNLLREYRADMRKLYTKLKWQKRWLRITAFSTSLFLIILVGACVLFTPETLYFSDYVWVNGHPQGIYALTQDEAAGRTHYAFTVELGIGKCIPGRITHVQRLDPAGNPVNEQLDLRLDRAAEIELPLKDSALSGSTSVAIFYDQDHRYLYQAENAADLSDITYSNRETGEKLPLPYDTVDMNVYEWAGTNNSESTSRSASQMTSRHIVRDEQGREAIVTYRNGDIEYADGNGLTSMTYDYDDLGRIISIDYQYNPGKLPGQTDALLLPGQNEDMSLLAGDRIIRRTFVYTAHLLTACTDFFADGSSTRREYVYNDADQCVAEAYYSAADAETPSMTRCWTYDPVSALVQTEYTVDADGQYILAKEGYARLTNEYTDGRLTLQSRYDTEGQLIKSSVGWAQYHCVYSEENGNLKRVTYYTNQDGYLMERDYYYDVAVYGDDTYTISYYDAEWKMIPRGASNYYQFRRTVKDNGDTIIIEYLDAEGRLMNNSDGYARQVTVYSGSLPRSRSFFDQLLQPTNYHGVSKTEWAYNAKRQIDRTTLESATGLYPMGYDCIANRYDDYGRLLYTSYSLNGRPSVPASIGYATVSYQYDDKANTYGWTYLDTKANAIMNKSMGFAQIVKTQDEKGQTIREDYYGADGIPTANANQNGACRVDFDTDNHVYTYYINPGASDPAEAMCFRRTYDERNRVTELLWLNADMQPVNRPNDTYAGILYEYGQINGQNAEKRFYIDAQGQPAIKSATGASRAMFIYNNDRKIVHARYANEDGKAFFSTQLGYAAYDQTYDEQGRLTSTTYLGADGKPIIYARDGYATILTEYDEAGNLVRERYLDTDGQPIIAAHKNAASVTWTYDISNKRTSCMFWDTEGHPIVNPENGYASAEYTIDGQGKTISTTCYDEYGQPVVMREYIREKEDINAMFSMGYTEQILSNDYAWTLDQLGSNGLDAYSAELAFLPIDLFIREPSLQAKNSMYYRNHGANLYLDLLVDILLSSTNDSIPYENSDLLTTPENKLFVYPNVMTLQSTSVESRSLTSSNGAEMLLYELDANGNRVREQFGQLVTGDDGKEVFIPGVNETVGYMTCVRHFDDHGNLTLLCYLDEADEPVVPTYTDYAVMASSYNNKNHLTGRAFFSIKFTTIPYEVGYEACRIIYDEHERTVGIKYCCSNEPYTLDEDHMPVVDEADFVLRNHSIFGYARDVFTYHEDGSCTHTYYDDEGNEVDPFVDGTTVSVQLREPVVLGSTDGSEGPYTMTLLEELTALNGRVYERRYQYQDENGADAYLVIDYDNQRNPITYSAYDARWQPVVMEELGCARLCQVYQTNNQLVGQYYLYTDGSCMMNRLTGNIARTFGYDECGWFYHDFDVNGELMYDSDDDPLFDDE